MKKDGKLASLFGFIALIGIVVGLYLLSPTITGNLIGNLSKTNSTLIGAVCLIIGIFAGYKSLKE